MGARSEIVTHTALRGVASILVVLFHYRSFLHPSVSPDAYTAIIREGRVWVDLFFALSGFILCYVYLPQRNTNGRTSLLTSYAVSRFARIYPLHLVTLLFVFFYFFVLGILNLIHAGTFCCLLDNPFRSWGSLAYNIFLVHAWGVLDVPTWNIPSWSISVEFGCYLLFFAILAQPPSMRNKAIHFFAIVAMIAYTFLGLNFAVIDENFRLSLIRGIAAFSLGMLAYLHKESVKKIPEAWINLLQIALVFTIIYLLHIDSNDTLVILLMPLLIVVTSNDTGWLYSAARLKSIYVVGLYSYFIYLWHYPIKFVALKISSIFGPFGEAASVLFVFILIAIVIAISAVSYNLFEMPVRRRIKVWCANKDAA